MGSFLQDLRFAWRSLGRAPGYAAVIIGTLALGVGVNTLIFGMVNTMALKPLPYINENGLVSIFTVDVSQGDDANEVSMPDFIDIRERATSFEAIAAYTESQAYLTLDREPERFPNAFISPGLFKALGVKPQLGREFLPHEEKDGNQWSSVIISDKIWRERLNSDPNILGRTFKMNGRIRTVVGVAPPNMRWPETAYFYIPFGYKPDTDNRAGRYVDVVARLKPGVTLAKANAEVQTIVADLARKYPESN